MMMDLEASGMKNQCRERKVDNCVDGQKRNYCEGGIIIIIIILVREWATEDHSGFLGEIRLI